MKKLLVMLVVMITLMVIGCAGATRYSLDPGEDVYEFTGENTTSISDAFSKTKLWFAENAGNYQKVVMMEDLASGTIVLKPTMQVKVVSTYLYMKYTLTIKVSNETISFKFLVGQLENGYYAPKDQMENIKAEFKAISDGIINSL